MTEVNSLKSPREIQNDECTAFQDLMAERIGAGEDLLNDPHMQTCDLCRALWRDLQSIAEAARELMKVELEPPNSDEIFRKILGKLDHSDEDGKIVE